MEFRRAERVWATARGLARAPSFALFAVVLLALAIGGTLGVFAVVNRVLAGQQPWSDPSTLLFLERRLLESDIREDVWNYPRERQIEALANPIFSAVAAVGPTTVIIQKGPTSRTEALKAEFVSPEYFRVVGSAPRLGGLDIGRGDTDPLVGVISDRLWLRNYQRSPLILGQRLAINGVTITIVGVASAAFRGTSGGVDLWVPLAAAPTVTGEREALSSSYWAYRIVVRVRSGSSAGERSARLRELTAKLGLAALPRGASRLSLIPPNQALVDAKLRIALGTLLGAAVSVLLLACANVAGLSVVRTLSLLHDMAIRIALGARKEQLAVRFILEGAIVALSGTLLGLVLSHWAIVALWASRPSVGTWVRILSTLDAPSVDPRSIVLAMGTCVVVMAFIVSWPMREVRRQFEGRGTLLVGASPGPTGGIRRGSPIRRYLACVQIALSFVLLESAVLLVSTVVTLNHERFGTRPEGLTVVKLQLPRAQYDAARASAFYRNLLLRAGSVPGVDAVSVDNTFPLENASSRTSAVVMDPRTRVQAAAREVRYHAVGQDHSRALGAALVSGRGVRSGSVDEGPTEMVLSATAARLLFPGMSPIGQTVASPSLSGSGTKWRRATVVGVVEDVQYDAPGSPLEPDVYVSAVADPPLTAALLIRSHLPASTLRRAMERVTHSIDSPVLVSEAQSMSEWLAQATSGTRFVARIVVCYAILAFLIAIIGTYSVVAYDVALRGKEFAIMRAVGAPAGAILRDVFRSGSGIAIRGIIGGVLGSIAVARLLTNQLYGVSVLAAWPFALCIVFLALSSLVASLVPAIRALRISPLVALAS